MTGRLPFWSDRLGLGIPLVAVRYVATFYPTNWLLYRVWNVRTAYRMSIWLHWLALAAATLPIPEAWRSAAQARHWLL